MNRMFLLILICISSGAAGTVPAPSAPSTSTGNYTVTFKNFYDGQGYDFALLEEKVGAEGTWAEAASDTSTLVQNGAMTEMSFKGKSAGTFYYRVKAFKIDVEIICGGGECSGGNLIITEHYSSVVPVTVTLGPPPAYEPLETQQEYQYEVRQGDVNNDGRQDLYIRRISGGDADNGVLYETVLQQLRNGKFTVYPASYGELANAAYWPLATIDIVLEDLNLDGYVDLVTQGLASSFPGLDEQVIFSSGVPYSRQANAVTAADQDFVNFFRDVKNWMLDPGYFDQAMVPQIGYQVSINMWRTVCEFYVYPYFGYACQTPHPHGAPINIGTYSLADLGVTSPLHNAAAFAAARQKIAADVALVDCYYLDLNCDPWCGSVPGATVGLTSEIFYWHDVWTQTTVTERFDSTNYSRKAWDLSKALAVPRENEAIDAGTPEAVDVVRILKEVLGVDIMGGVLENGGIRDIEEDTPAPLRRMQRLGEIFEAIHRTTIVITRDEEEEHRRQAAIQDVADLIDQGVIDTNKVFRSHQDAAKNILDILRTVTLEHYIEIGGEIYSIVRNGERIYKYTVPVVGTSRRIPSEIGDLPLETIPPEGRHEADYHTHPSPGYTAHSAPDKNRAQRYGVGSYVRSSVLVYYYYDETGGSWLTCGVDFNPIGETRYQIPRCD